MNQIIIYCIINCGYCWNVICSIAQTLQEEVAQENNQKMESEKQTVHEAKEVLDKHAKAVMDIDKQYSDVRARLDQLAEEMDPLKVRMSKCWLEMENNILLNH